MTARGASQGVRYLDALVAVLQLLPLPQALGGRGHAGHGGDGGVSGPGPGPGPSRGAGLRWAAPPPAPLPGTPRWGRDKGRGQTWGAWSDVGA